MDSTLRMGSPCRLDGTGRPLEPTPRTRGVWSRQGRVCCIRQASRRPKHTSPQGRWPPGRLPVCRLSVLGTRERRNHGSHQNEKPSSLIVSSLIWKVHTSHFIRESRERNLIKDGPCHRAGEQSLASLKPSRPRRRRGRLRGAETFHFL